ncbi:hypothetical protein CALVIDRAFT_602000 [Calocera viscosa TUFC12733]|uniref:Uncharacterized protein n=1 Tax=Calocera viscosa (strain TUFC12733) TaxID=1330018 RepID=A0A167HMK1_CALVF|nr:hypothetical protein CALVIDRAFT_602000 [Calocera viscosa TUFC12733]
MRTSNSAGPLDRRDVDASDASDGWTLWFGEDGGMLMLPLVGEVDDGDMADTGSSPDATPTSSPVPTSTSATLTSQALSTPTPSHTPSSTPTASASPATSSALSSSATLPHGALLVLLILGVGGALAATVWLLTRFWRSRRRRAHELEDGEGYYPFGAEFGIFRGMSGWSRPSSPSLKRGRSGKGGKSAEALDTPELAHIQSREQSEKLPAIPLPKRLSDGPYPTTLQLPTDFAADDPFPAPVPGRTKLTVANLTSRDVSVSSGSPPSVQGSPHPAGLFNRTPRSPWSGEGDGFRSPAVVVSSPTTASVASLPAPAPADGWNNFKATVSSAMSSFSSQFSRPSQVHMSDSFTHAVRRSQSVLTSSSDGSIRRARALDRAQMAGVISLGREAPQAPKDDKPVGGLPSPHISTPNPFDDEMIRFGSPLSEGGLSRSTSQREGLGPRRMPTTSSTYSRSSFR